jgi:RHS repeat-associated protein
MVNAVLHANNVTVTHVKDDFDIRRPKSITTTNATPNWASGTYGYDGAGNVKAIGSDWYTYDKVSRLTVGTTSATAQRQCAAFNAFGAINGLGTGTSSCTASPISIDAATNRMASPVGYNAAGSMLVWGGFNYAWDPLNQMASTWGTGITKRTFLYTADGERIEERVGSDALNPTSITIAARGLDAKVLRLFTKPGGTWSWTKDYVYRDGLSLASIDASGTKHFHLDHLGTIRRITNASRAVVGSHDYFPFGLEATSASQDTERMKFTGHERDLQGTTSQTDDLDYLHARYYNFNIARFLSVDPGRDVDPKLPQAWNMYAYVRNNPVNETDPDGNAVNLLWDIPDLAIGAASIGNLWVKALSGEQITAADNIDAISGAVGMLPIITGAAVGGKLVTFAAKADDAADAARAAVNESSVASTSRAARRESTRQAGIPTSQQPVSQSSPRGPGNKPAGRELVYDTPTGQTRVQHQLQDRRHNPHWEAGRAKPGGQTDPAGRPRLTNDKKKVSEVDR